jgi:SAM-dependent methyltransferase
MKNINNCTYEKFDKIINNKNITNMLVFGDLNDMPCEEFLNKSIKYFATYEKVNGCESYKVVIRDTNYQYINPTQEIFDFVWVGNSFCFFDDIETFLGSLLKLLKNGATIAGCVLNMNYIGRITDLFNGNWCSRGYTLEEHHSLEKITNVFDKFQLQETIYIPIKPELSLLEIKNIEKMKDTFKDFDVEMFTIKKYLFKVRKDESKVLIEKIRNEMIFYLKRIEHDICVEQSLNTIADFFSEEIINCNEFIKIIHNVIINVDKVENILGVKAYELGLIEFSFEMLNDAYGYNSSNEDVTYNLSLLLMQLGEKTIALDLLIKLNSSREDICKLVKQLEGVHYE